MFPFRRFLIRFSERYVVYTANRTFASLLSNLDRICFKNNHNIQKKKKHVVSVTVYYPIVYILRVYNGETPKTVYFHAFIIRVYNSFFLDWECPINRRPIKDVLGYKQWLRDRISVFPSRWTLSFLESFHYVNGDGRNCCFRLFPPCSYWMFYDNILETNYNEKSRDSRVTERKIVKYFWTPDFRKIKKKKNRLFP